MVSLSHTNTRLTCERVRRLGAGCCKKKLEGSSTTLVLPGSPNRMDLPEHFSLGGLRVVKIPSELKIQPERRRVPEEPG